MTHAIETSRTGRAPLPRLAVVVAALALLPPGSPAAQPAPSRPQHVVEGRYERSPESRPGEVDCGPTEVRYEDEFGPVVMIGGRLMAILAHPASAEAKPLPGLREALWIDVRNTVSELVVRNVITTVEGRNVRTDDRTFVFRGPVVQLRLESRLNDRRLELVRCTLRHEK